jgi:ABC-2 type transport system ATP-binding protein
VRYIHQLATEQQLAVLWATHLIDEIYPEDNLLILHQGQLKAEGQVADILQFTAKETIQAAFHYLTQGA